MVYSSLVQLVMIEDAAAIAAVVDARSRANVALANKENDKLCRILTTIIIATLIKSSSAGLSLVGYGACLSYNGKGYDFVSSLSGQANDYTTAYNWCLTATSYKSSLVGLSIGNGYWFCHYDNGSIDNIQKTDFIPVASYIDISHPGTGAVDIATGSPAYQCYKNEVCQIDSNCMNSILTFFHGVPNS
jgi:hypothetical protein